jgi:dihydrofolate reductase
VRRIVAGLGMSLDGVSDTPSNWLDINDEAAAIMAHGIGQADAILLGRTTYLAFAELWPPLGDSTAMAAFLNGAKKFVVSKTLSTAEANWGDTTVLSGDVAEEVFALKHTSGANIQVPGSPKLVSGLINLGLLDELAIMVAPLVLGSGPRLFDNVVGRRDLRLIEARPLGNGVLYLNYQPSNG